MLERSLTDADVVAIVDAIEKRATEKFYRDLGKGLWGIVWRGLIGVALVVAAWGAARQLGMRP